MCKYCNNVFDEKENIYILFFKRFGPVFKNRIDKWKNKNKKQIAIIINEKSNCNHLNKGPVLSIKGKNKNNSLDWFDLKINYCPVCGKQLREKIISEEQIDG